MNIHQYRLASHGNLILDQSTAARAGKLSEFWCVIDESAGLSNQNIRLCDRLVYADTVLLVVTTQKPDLGLALGTTVDLATGVAAQVEILRHVYHYLTVTADWRSAVTLQPVVTRISSQLVGRILIHL